jgi:hypothetical protein
MSSSLTPRRLHSMGVAHSHNLFDSGSNATGAHSDADAFDEASFEAMELENRKRAVTMSVLFCTLMIVYIGFCFYYQKVHKVRRRIGDSVHRHPRGGREEQRRTNRAVLDESSNAAHRARTDGHMARMFDERRDKIRAALITALLVDEGRHDAGDNVAGSQSEALEQSASDTLEHTPAEDIAVTPATSQETCDSDNIAHPGGHPATTAAPAVATEIPTSSSSSCVDFKRYADALQSSISSGTRFVCSPQNANHCSGGGGSCSNSIHNGCNVSSHNSQHNPGSKQPNDHSSHFGGNGNNATMLSILQNEECNICLSYFQVGDRIAWSCKNQAQFVGSSSSSANDSSPNNGMTVKADSVCRHIFHAECIERWLLVREGCPVCRRSYFEDLQENDPGQVTEGNIDMRNHVVVESHEEDGDLELGDNNDTHEQVMTSTLARVVAVEE